MNEKTLKKLVRDNFSKLIAEKREYYGHTQRQMSEKLGVSHNAISYWEKKERMPSLDLAIRFCIEYGVHIEKLKPYIPEEN